MNAAAMIHTEEELELERKKELVRKDGRDFIKVKWVGDYKTEEQLRIHGIKDIVTAFVTDTETGRQRMVSREMFGTTRFVANEATGDLYTELWDDPDDYNRMWISRNPELYVIDDKMRLEVEKLKDQPYITEMNEKQRLLREREKIERRLRAIDKKEAGGGAGEEKEKVQPEAPEPPSEKRAPGRKFEYRRRPGRKRIAKENIDASNNESDMHVGGTGVSRVAEGGAEGVESMSGPRPYAPTGL